MGSLMMISVPILVEVEISIDPLFLAMKSLQSYNPNPDPFSPLVPYEDNNCWLL